MSGRWTPGIGDPSVVGWLTVVAYLAAAAWCAALAWRHARGPRLDRWFWGALALMTLALGINKQLDIQSLFTQVLRDEARLHGWFAERRVLQAAFILATGFAGAVLAVVAWKWLPVLHRNMRTALIGLIFVYTYVMIRAASFHHVDFFINRELFGVKWNWILELGGITIILHATVREWRSGGPHRAGSRG
ncbi:hypothetical protein [Sphingomonas phyllosphaerae]|uniref:hypothetical protein n=1 Tax=Sphingomonas phyllosphaerae TaxID=257003 RepID=UPI0003B5A2BD|nr:hypothetical protein [Sphingomonas phyllosphaerae]